LCHEPASRIKIAAGILKVEDAREGIKCEQLCERLLANGIKENYKGLANKINRDASSYAFFFQCMQAIGRKDFRV